MNTCGARSQNEQEKIITKAQHDNSGFIKGKKVIDSNVTLNAESKIWGTTIITQFSGPPQVQETTIANLAFMHMQGLIGFAILSPNNRNNSIYLSKKCFHFYQSFSKDNWGSPSLEFLRTLTLPWEPLLIKTTAKNNFKVYIKSNNEIIFWLLEWNMYYRVCGFIGNSIECSKIIDSIPEEPYRYVGKDKDGISLFYVVQFHYPIILLISFLHSFEDRRSLRNNLEAFYFQKNLFQSLVSFYEFCIFFPSICIFIQMDG